MYYFVSGIPEKLQVEGDGTDDFLGAGTFMSHFFQIAVQ